jgi:TonB family protein
VKSTLTLAIAVCLICSTSLLAHGNPSSTGATDQIGIEVLGNTQGVELGPYLQTVEKSIKLNWYNLIPESARAPIMKRGDVVIEFAILKDGKVAGMKLVSSSGDVALDRGAWGAITACNPFPPPPLQLAGSVLALPVPFHYNSNSDSTLWVRVPEQVRLSEILIATPQPSNSAQIAEAAPEGPGLAGCPSARRQLRGPCQSQLPGSDGSTRRRPGLFRLRQDGFVHSTDCFSIERG